MRSSLRRRALRPGRIDGLKIRIVDGPSLTDAELGHAFRLLARMMIRSCQADTDNEAIIPDTKSSSELTVAARARPVNTNEAA